jgi:hypothetical protein
MPRRYGALFDLVEIALATALALHSLTSGFVPGIWLGFILVIILLLDGRENAQR